MKIEELTIPQLNHWVAKALGWEQRLWGAIPVWFDPANENRYRCHVSQWNPSENWVQGGPIIEREIRSIGRHQYDDDGAEGVWKLGDAFKCQLKGMGFVGEGKTILEAAMRAFVGDKFGEEVPQP